MNKNTNQPAVKPLIASKVTTQGQPVAMTVIGRLYETDGTEFVQINAIGNTDAETKFVAAVAENYGYTEKEIEKRGYTIYAIVAGHVDYFFLRGAA